VILKAAGRGQAAFWGPRIRLFRTCYGFGFDSILTRSQAGFGLRPGWFRQTAKFVSCLMWPYSLLTTTRPIQVAAADRFGGQIGNGQGQEGPEGRDPSRAGGRGKLRAGVPFRGTGPRGPRASVGDGRELEKLLSTWGDNTSPFSAAKPSSMGTGVICEFRNSPGGRVTCPYFPAVSCEGARQHQLRDPAAGSEVTYICHGESCKAAPRSGNFCMGVLPLPIAAAFGDSQPLNSERDHMYSDRQVLPLPFLRENLNVKKGESECNSRPGLPLLRTVAFYNFCSLLVQPASPFGLLTT
jgi:hypothetical protein